MKEPRKTIPGAPVTQDQYRFVEQYSELKKWPSSTVVEFALECLFNLDPENCQATILAHQDADRGALECNLTNSTVPAPIFRRYQYQRKESNIGGTKLVRVALDYLRANLKAIETEQSYQIIRRLGDKDGRENSSGS